MKVCTALVHNISEIPLFNFKTSNIVIYIIILSIMSMNGKNLSQNSLKRGQFQHCCNMQYYTRYAKPCMVKFTHDLPVFSL